MNQAHNNLISLGLFQYQLGLSHYQHKGCLAIKSQDQALLYEENIIILVSEDNCRVAPIVNIE